jgi:DedD protein
MGLLSFLKRGSGDAASPPPEVDVGDPLQKARTLARQRLMGAVVLVALGVVGFPMLFETQPRPLPVNTPIEIARKEVARAGVTAASLAATNPSANPPKIIQENAADAGREVGVPAVVPLPVPKPLPSLPAVLPQTQTKPPHPAAAPQAKPAKPVPKPEPTPGKRFVVQAASYASATSAREARQKIEKLGFATYVQEIDTDAGQRIRVRVGPFPSRAQADQALNKLKAAGMSSTVLSL